MEGRTMKPRDIRDDIQLLGAVDWNRRLFDALIPLPDGTSYNAYLVRGTEKTALLDTVDPTKADTLLYQLEGVPQVDYLISHHAEQDHSGVIPQVLEKYPQCKIICTARAASMLADLLCLSSDRFQIVKDGDKLSLGGKTFEFLFTPWVHWPETMLSYLHEQKILFTCDFFGAHLATSNLYAVDEPIVYEAAKRYYAEIMMPFRKIIRRHLERVKKLSVDLIAPSHGPIYHKPEFILDAYWDWVTADPKNNVVLPYASMHGSTQKLVEYLVSALAERGVGVHQFDLAVTDIGKLAIALVDAATLVLGSPTVHVGPHPLAVYAANLANALRPKVRFASVIGSYGWSDRAVRGIATMIPHLQVELLEPVLCQGFPRHEHFEDLDRLAGEIAEKHRQHNLT
jgi:flavorubredoxin